MKQCAVVAHGLVSDDVTRRRRNLHTKEINGQEGSQRNTAQRGSTGRARGKKKSSKRDLGAWLQKLRGSESGLRVFALKAKLNNMKRSCKEGLQPRDCRPTHMQTHSSVRSQPPERAS